MAQSVSSLLLTMAVLVSLQMKLVIIISLLSCQWETGYCVETDDWTLVRFVSLSQGQDKILLW